MKLTKFNKGQSLNRLDGNKNNKKTKHFSVIISVGILILAIIYFSFARFESIKSYSLIKGTVGNFGNNLADFFFNLNSSDLQYDGVGTLGENGTPDNNLRYIGSNPNNYIYFNCETDNPSEMSNETCEKWRVVGVFNNVEDSYGKKASRVKIVSDYSYEYDSWDISDSSINSGKGINQWGESTYQDGTPYDGSLAKKILNEDFLTIPQKENTNLASNKKILPSFMSEASGEIILDSPYLNERGQSMIQEIKWNTGAMPLLSEGSINNNNYDIYKVKNIYLSERSDTTGKMCEEDEYCNDMVIRTTTWIGKVALLYASDAGYSIADNVNTTKEECLNTPWTNWPTDGASCTQESWLHYYYSGWSLTPYASSSSASTIQTIQMYDNTNEYASERLYLYPTLYLKTNLQIVGGDGTTQHPFILTK
ncbi:MAG: hypothetical protein E7159_06290 [Firmicutes bacterium]|nr:hypothetical protein [Bacillota bacterium]